MNLMTRAGIVVLCCTSYQSGYAQGLPAFIDQLISEYEAALPSPGSELPPGVVIRGTRVQPSTLENWQHEYQGETVYYLPTSLRDCCDAFSRLYDADGNHICYPEGGITGEGDGRCPSFVNNRGRGTRIYGGSRSEEPSSEDEAADTGAR